MVGSKVELNGQTTVFTESDIYEQEGYTVVANDIIVCYQDNFTVDDFVIPEKGVYFSPQAAGMKWEIGTVYPLDTKYLPEGIGGGLEVIKLTYNDSDGMYYSDKTRNEIKALVAEGKQCVFFNGTYYSTVIDIFGGAVIRGTQTGNIVGDSVNYYIISVGVSNTKVTLSPVVNTPYFFANSLVYELSVGADGTVTATQVTDGSVIGK